LDFKDGFIDECIGCNQAKLIDYDLCLVCERRKPTAASVSRRGETNQTRWYKPEYSPSWDVGDAEADQFYVYILKLEGGSFYAGQTRELKERLSEHRDGKASATRGKNPRLVWFDAVPSREIATSTEVDLKKLVDPNPREIRRMVIKFQGLVQEVVDL